MIRWTRKKEHPAEPVADGVIRATARVDSRTKNLITRLQPGEIAVINHEDIDRITAEGLIQRQASAVVNAGRSSSGRYPNLGPLLLVSAGIPVIDAVGPALMNVPDGAMVRVERGRIFRDDIDAEVGKGHVLTLEGVE